MKKSKFGSYIKQRGDNYMRFVGFLFHFWLRVKLRLAIRHCYTFLGCLFFLTNNEVYIFVKIKCISFDVWRLTVLSAMCFVHGMCPLFWIKMKFRLSGLEILIYVFCLQKDLLTSFLFRAGSIRLCLSVFKYVFCAGMKMLDCLWNLFPECSHWSYKSLSHVPWYRWKSQLVSGCHKWFPELISRMFFYEAESDNW